MARTAIAVSLAVIALVASLWLLWFAPTRVARLVSTSPTGTPPTRPSTMTPTTAMQTLPTTAAPTHMPSPTSTRAATPTITPTLTPSPTATSTPVHAPANGDPTRLQVPAIGLDVTLHPVQTGDDHTIPDDALEVAVYHLGSARPGHPGNVIISGPANVTNPLLQPLQQLTHSDRLYVWVGVVPYRYTVQEVWRYGEQAVSPGAPDDPQAWFADTDDQWVTVIAGWPCEADTGCTVLRALPSAWNGDEN
ncbi:MAG: sortase domain-bontaining protein [Anaerolineae bacterium]